MEAQQSSEDTPKSDGGDNTTTTPKGHQFDFLNWFYWNLWWQHYSYWTMMLQNPHAFVPPGMGTRPGHVHGSHPGTTDNEPMLMNMYPPPPHQQQHQFGSPFPNQQQQPQQATPHGFVPQIQIRIITGFETYIAPVWRRCLAEVIDMFLFGILLKMYFPEVDYRVPEVIFKGPEIWKTMEDEELLDTRDTLMLFLVSVVLQRFLHAILEMGWLVVFRCTPGKWLMGLRVWRCTSTPHLTQTTPGYSIRVEPGGRISVVSAFLRSLFKATVSLFVPTIVFFFHMTNGRTKYDELFNTAVVDTYSLNRPIYGTLRNIQLQQGQQNGQQQGHVIRPQFQIG